ncbi:MAG: hypothetical protein ACRDYZ_05910 [Acidimicrobiales bacterium]
MGNAPMRFSTGWDVVTFTMMGTHAAADRLSAVSWHDPHLAYAAAGETLWWMTTLDTMLKRFLGASYTASRRAENVIDGQLSGIRYARGRFTHAFDILEVVEPGYSDEQQSFNTPGYWKWSPLSASRRSGVEPGEKEYRGLLAGTYVNSTLTNVLTFLRAQATRSSVHKPKLL